MKALLIVIALMAGMAQHTVSAHGTHGVDEASAIAIVHQAIPKLTTKDFGFEAGQLDSSWKSIAEGDISVVETDGDFYVMRATNSTSKATIFLLIGINGQVMQVKTSNDF